MYKKYFKRAFDLCFALIFLCCFWWLLLFIAVLVRKKLGSPVLFEQVRPGKDERLFTMYKFRTMTDERDSFGNLLADEFRLTSFGRWMRKTSLDELPEIINILKGEMSLIGPRPQLVRDMIFMTPEQRKRHSVMPGLSGLAQVRGRNDISWEDKFKYDLEYINTISFLGDLKLIFETLFKTARCEYINTTGMATAEDLGDYLLRTGKISYVQYKDLHEHVREGNGSTKIC